MILYTGTVGRIEACNCRLPSDVKTSHHVTENSWDRMTATLVIFFCFQIWSLIQYLGLLWDARSFFNCIQKKMKWIGMVEASSASWRPPFLSEPTGNMHLTILWFALKCDILNRTCSTENLKVLFCRKNSDSSTAELSKSGAKFLVLHRQMYSTTEYKTAGKDHSCSSTRRINGFFPKSPESHSELQERNDPTKIQFLKIWCNCLLHLTIRSRNQQAPTPTDWETDGSQDTIV